MKDIMDDRVVQCKEEITSQSDFDGKISIPLVVSDQRKHVMQNFDV
jgi:hypothetical protein